MNVHSASPHFPIPRPRFVFFDLDDTLLDHTHAERSALADLYAAHAEHLGHHSLAHVRERYHAANAPLWVAIGEGRITSDELRRLRPVRVLDALGVTALDPVAFGEAYLDRYGAHWRWLTGARDAFLATAARVPVGILTNGFREQQRAKLARFPEIEATASVIVVSDEVGAMKPQRLLFDHALVAACEATGKALRPEDVLLVGDSLTSDVAGALGAGWQAVWIGSDAARAPRGVAVFASVTEWANEARG